MKDFEPSQQTLKTHIPLGRKEKERLEVEKAWKYVQSLKAAGFDEKTVGKLRTSMEQVCFILEQHPSAKGNYRVLDFYWKKHFEPIKTGDFEKDVVRGTSPETYFRAARKLRKHGFYPASVKRQMLRVEREKVFHKSFARGELDEFE